MTITEQPTPTRFELVAFDLYKDVHKGIRSELFVAHRVGRATPTPATAAPAPR